MISCPCFSEPDVLRADSAHDLTEEVEVLGIFTSFGRRCRLFLAPASFGTIFFSRKLVLSRGKKGVTGRKKRMRSQQESCCGLALAGLSGLKLIWKFCTLSDCPGLFFFSFFFFFPFSPYIKHRVVSSPRRESKPSSFECAARCVELRPSGCRVHQKLLLGRSRVVAESLKAHTKVNFHTRHTVRADSHRADSALRAPFFKMAFSQRVKRI